MSSPFSDPRDDEPAVVHPQLRMLTELARAQRLPPLQTELPAITARAARERHGRARTFVAAAVLAAAAIALVWSLRERRMLADEKPAAEQAARSLEDTPGGIAVEPHPQPVRDTVTSDREEPEPVPPVVEPEVVPVVVPEVGTPRTTPLDPPRKPALDAAALARQAEQAMAEQRRGDAIRALGTLVRRFPKSSAARAALLDLGRLLRADGRRDEARCAYRQLIARWPADPMRKEIDRALRGLGEGPACRGLEPVR